MKNYAFQGEVIKLTSQHFNKWCEVYPHLDLTEELQQLDMELSLRLEMGEMMNKWFVEVFQRLNGRNKRARMNGAPKRSMNNISAQSTRSMSIQSEFNRDWANTCQ